MLIKKKSKPTQKAALRDNLFEDCLCLGFKLYKFQGGWINFSYVGIEWMLGLSQTEQ